MPTITINRKEFDRLVGKKLPDEMLRDRISYLGTDLESVTDSEITVEIFPNRPDMLSVQGFARAFSSFVGISPGLRKYDVMDSGESVIVEKSVCSVRPYTACAIVKGLKFDDQSIKDVIQVQEKLHVTYGRNRRKAAIGIYPCEKISFPIRFLARKPEDIRFRPLEFPKELNALQILRDHPTGREYAHLLEGLGLYPVFVDADGQVLSMPPIINSHLTGKIDGSTTDVFIECSGFDFNVLRRCLNMIVAALADMGGRVYSVKLVYPEKTYVSPELAPVEMPFDRLYIERRLGIPLPEEKLKGYLGQMGFGYRNKRVQVPAYRADVLHQIDFAEDIAIAYGYENFEAIIPNAATIGEEDPFEIFKNKIAAVLVGLGITEVNTYNLTSRDFQTRLMGFELSPIELLNSLSQEFNVLRGWMLPSLVEVLKNNRHNEYPQDIFGFGTVFSKDESQETGILEEDCLAITLCNELSDYTSARKVLECLLGSIDVSYRIDSTDHPSFIPGRVARLMVGSSKIGFFGELHPAVLKNWGLELPVAAIELNLSKLFDA
jgi:phenylalanyl-tRNA synthetase beta chain